MRSNEILDAASVVAFFVMTGAAIHAFGLFHGLGAACAVWLLSPYRRG